MQDTTAAQNGTGHDIAGQVADLADQVEAVVDVATAAARLGISEDGVCWLPAIKGTDGQWSIPAAALAKPHTTARQDRTKRLAAHDPTLQDTGYPPAGAAPASDQAATLFLITCPCPGCIDVNDGSGPC